MQGGEMVMRCGRQALDAGRVNDGTPLRGARIWQSVAFLRLKGMIYDVT